MLVCNIIPNKMYIFIQLNDHCLFFAFLLLPYAGNCFFCPDKRKEVRESEFTTKRMNTNEDEGNRSRRVGGQLKGEKLSQNVVKRKDSRLGQIKRLMMFDSKAPTNTINTV